VQKNVGKTERVCGIAPILTESTPGAVKRLLQAQKQGHMNGGSIRAPADHRSRGTRT